MLFNALSSPDSSETSASNHDESSLNARSECIKSARALADLYRRFYKDFGSQNFTMWMPQTALSTAYLLLEHLHDVEIQDLFHETSLVITSVARKWFVMRGHARMLFITAGQRGKVIPNRTKQLLAHIALDSWHPNDHELFDASMYPNYALARDEDPRAAGMGDLLKQWANIDLETESTRTRSIFDHVHANTKSTTILNEDDERREN